MSKLKTSDFKAASYNPRVITESGLMALDKSFTEFGDLSGVVINQKSNTVVSGHQRLKTIKGKKTRVVTKKVTDKYGTVEIGHIEVVGARGEFTIPLRVVNWDTRREMLANIAANNLGGKFDNQKLGVLLAKLDKDKFDVELTGMDSNKVQTLIRRSLEEGKPADKKYVKKLSSPIYEPTGKKPAIKNLYDTSKTEELKARIRKTVLPPEVKLYLLAAAERHTKFRYDLAAEFYAHSPKAIQELMEDCALVIVDYKKAIEHGYLKVSDEIADMVKNEE